MSSLDALLELDLLRPTAVPRRFMFRHPLVRRAVYESAPAGWRLAAHARAAADSRRPRGRRRGAGSPRRAVRDPGRRGGDRSCCWRPARPRPRGHPRPPHAGSRRLFDSCPPPTSSARSTCASPSRRRSAPSASSTGVARRCWRRSSCCPPDAVARRVELTTQCAAVEHWLGRHGEAHRRLTRAWEDIPDRSTAEAAVLEIELAVDGLYELDFDQATEMGAAGPGDRRRGG